MNLITRWSESVVEHPGSPPKCVSGSSQRRVLWYTSVSAMHADKTFARHSPSVMGQYALARE